MTEPVETELVARLRGQLAGSGAIHVCCHPDVELPDLPIDHPDRACVLDEGRGDDCDIASSDHLSDKTNCPFWDSKMRVEPKLLSIKQGGQLLDEIERLQAELREACHERDGYHAERDMARERLEWSSDQPYDGIAARDETIVGLQAELARVRKLGEAMAMELDHMGTWIVKRANPGRELKYNTSPARAALAAWIAEAGR